MSAGKLKAVLILGSGNESYHKDLLKLYAQPGYLAIGDGINSLTKQDISVLQGKIDLNTRINIVGHGAVYYEQHYIWLQDKDPQPTYELFSWLQEYGSYMPLQIHFWSCYGGTANTVVKFLGEGSVLFNHIPSQHLLLASLEGFSNKNNFINTRQTHNEASSIEDFIDNLSYKLMQTASIATYIDDETHELILAPKLSEVIANPGKVLEEEVIKITDFANKIHGLIAAKDQCIYSVFEIKEPIAKSFSEQEKNEFKVGYFIHACHTGNIKEIEQAIANNPAGLIKELVDKDIAGALPLYIAAQNGYNEIVNRLLAQGADVNKAMNNGATSIAVAAEKGKAEVIERLITHGADVNKATSDGVTPLFMAAQNKHIESIKILLAHGADVNKAKNDGTTPLWYAAQEGHTEVVKILIENNADVNKVMDGFTPLYRAVNSGHTEIAKVLIENKAYINAVMNNGHTTLKLACHLGKLEIVKMLVSAKAALHIKTSDGDSPLDLAKQEGHSEIVKFLEDAIEAEQKISVITDDHSHELIGEYVNQEATLIYQDEL